MSARVLLSERDWSSAASSERYAEANTVELCQAKKSPTCTKNTNCATRDTLYTFRN